jgi:hypothetical protein
MSAAVAHADPSFVLAESQARAGDVVHFSITGADDRVTYEVEVAGRDVLEGEAEGSVISGQFAMPHLGSSARSVEVEAEIREPDDRTTVERRLQYLGPAVAAPAPALPAPAAAPIVPQQTASPPTPPQSPAAAETTPSPAPKVKPRSKHRSKRGQRRHRRTRRTVARHREAPGSNKRAGRRRAHAKAKRTRRPAPRTAPLFDGVPEPDSGGYSAGPDKESSARKAGPPAAVLTAPVANSNGGEPAAAILVPGLLGLAGFILAAATLLRRRRSSG